VVKTLDILTSNECYTFSSIWYSPSCLTSSFKWLCTISHCGGFSLCFLHEDLVMCLFAIHVSSLAKCVAQVPCPFFSFNLSINSNKFSSLYLLYIIHFMSLSSLYFNLLIIEYTGFCHYRYCSFPSKFSVGFLLYFIPCSSLFLYYSIFLSKWSIFIVAFSKDPHLKVLLHLLFLSLFISWFFSSIFINGWTFWILQYLLLDVVALKNDDRFCP
jgi:hypothetical protein